METTITKQNTGDSIIGEISNSGDVNPFAKNSKIVRSPKLNAGIGTPKGDTTEETPEDSIMEIDLNEEMSDFQKLGAHIGHLVGMLADKKRRSINQGMRNTIDSIKAHFELAATQLRDEGAREVLKHHCASQTSPWLKKSLVVKRKLVNGEETPSAKRRYETPKPAKATRPQSAKPTPSRKKDAKTSQGDKEGEWRKVTRKKAPGNTKKSRRKLDKPRPDAIVIQTEDKSGDTYANILRRVKTDPTLKAIADSVISVRRTQKGDLLLQLKESGEKATEITNNIGVILGDTVTVRTLSQRVSIEIKDIDEVTDKEEICEALNGLLDSEGVTPSDVVSLRKAYSGTQAATVNLPAITAKSLLDVGKVKIGWSVCRLRERTTLTKCFKCLEFGHISKQCKNKEDRSKRCRNCGEEGHIAKDCKKPASCMFCKKDSPQQADHVAGSSRCPVFRRALSQKKR